MIWVRWDGGLLGIREEDAPKIRVNLEIALTAPMDKWIRLFWGNDQKADESYDALFRLYQALLHEIGD